MAKPLPRLEGAFEELVVEFCADWVARSFEIALTCS
jgi:hypothetical protein